MFFKYDTPVELCLRKRYFWKRKRDCHRDMLQAKEKEYQREKTHCHTESHHDIYKYIQRDILRENATHTYSQKETDCQRKEGTVTKRSSAIYRFLRRHISNERDRKTVRESLRDIYNYVYILRERDIFERVNDCRTNIQPARETLPEREEETDTKRGPAQCKYMITDTYF